MVIKKVVKSKSRFTPKAKVIIKHKVNAKQKSRTISSKSTRLKTSLKHKVKTRVKLVHKKTIAPKIEAAPVPINPLAIQATAQNYGTAMPIQTSVTQTINTPQTSTQTNEATNIASTPVQEQNHQLKTEAHHADHGLLPDLAPLDHEGKVAATKPSNIYLLMLLSVVLILGYGFLEKTGSIGSAIMYVRIFFVAAIAVVVLTVFMAAKKADPRKKK